jgi:NAD dependent epimerase/dehydratase
VELAGRKVLVTGAGGFIGSHLVERLSERGANVCALVRYNSNSAAGWLDRSPVRQHVDVVFSNVEDRDGVRKAMHGVDAVFHLAALIGIPYSYDAPDSYVRTNIGGTLNVLQAARDQQVGLVVHTSTSEVYGSAAFVPMTEEHPLRGQSPYSATKIGADKLAEAFHLSFGLPVVTVRPFNTYGPRQSERAVIPTIVAQVLGGQRLRLGNLGPTRDFTYVTDTVEGFIRAAESDRAIGQVVNLGTGTEVSIGDLAERIMAKVGRTVPVEAEDERIRPTGSEVDRLCSDNARARALLEWQPRVSLDEGLGRTIEWLAGRVDSGDLTRYVV